MKRLASALCCAAACSVAVVSAQTGTMDKDKMNKGMKSVMVTGCVSESTGHYMLTNAMMSGDMKGEMKGDMKGDMKPMTYGLMGGELKGHVGHKVEVSGTMDPSKSMDSAKMDKGKMEKDKTAGDKMGMSGDMHGSINVKSVKMISAACP